MRSGADNSVHLRGNPDRLLGINMGPTAERRAAGPEVAPIALELEVGIAPAEVLSHPLHGNICPTRHIVIQADGLALQAAQAWGGGDLEIYSVRGGGHDLHLHAVSPLGCSTAAVRGLREFLSALYGTEHSWRGHQRQEAVRDVDGRNRVPNASYVVLYSV